MWRQNGVPIGTLDERGVVGAETSLALLSDGFENGAEPSNGAAATVIWPKAAGSVEPRGVLCVSGPPVGRYLGGDSEDAFVSSAALLRGQNDQDEALKSKKWFCTGDIVSVIQGHLYFCGRTDNAVKVHGQRVNLEAVERAVAAALAGTEKEAPSRQVVAFTTTKEARKLALRQRSIVACIIREGANSSLVAPYAETNALKAWISEHYGASHIPQDVLVVPANAVQRLAHGKVDRRALEQLCRRDASASGLPTPARRCSAQSSTEKLLSRLLNEILDLPMADGISEDLRTRTFREVGGNSLLATLFVHELKQELGGCSLRGPELVRSLLNASFAPDVIS
jgi:acyl-CoA synthetase (AMP-forming)/AMP-acid ligase II